MKPVNIEDTTQFSEEISTDQINKKSSRQQRSETRLAAHWLLSISVLQTQGKRLILETFIWETEFILRIQVHQNMSRYSFSQN